jgi:dihydroorotase
MTELVALGIPFVEVVKMATVNCASTLGIEDEFGTIGVGCPANLSLVELVSGSWRLRDSSGTELVTDRLIHPSMAVRVGEVFQAESPLLPDLEELAA